MDLKAFLQQKSLNEWRLYWLVGWHRDYYVQEVYALRDVIEGLMGYAFLLAMVLTSFKPWRKRLSPKQWKHLHQWGIYNTYKRRATAK